MGVKCTIKFIILGQRVLKDSGCARRVGLTSTELGGVEMGSGTALVEQSEMELSERSKILKKVPGNGRERYLPS